MFLTKKATSIIEAMVILFIVTSWVVWMFLVFWKSQKLSESTSNKIQAIQIAREWIEAVKNIRDTNWILFSSDVSNCWNIDNYNNTCVWNNSTTNDISAWSYKIYQNSSDNKWYLSKKNTSETEYKKSDYRNEMKVWLDSNWFFTQTGTMTEIKPIFTREIKISYLSTSKMQIISLVQWKDLASDIPHKVEFKSILTNWKK